MRTITLPSALVLVAALGAGCAARIPPDATFNPSAWSRVENLAPGVRVEVRYVTGTPPLRHHFEGTLRRAAPDVLEIQTEDGVQRLLPQRVLQVAVGGRESLVMPLAIMGGLLGALYGPIDPPNEAVARRKRMLGSAIGAAVGLVVGHGIRDHPAVIYSRSGSL